MPGTCLHLPFGEPAACFKYSHGLHVPLSPSPTKAVTAQALPELLEGQHQAVPEEAHNETHLQL